MAGRCNALGGHVELGEDITASAVREVCEEAGLHRGDIDCDSVRITGVTHVMNFFGSAVMMFVVRMWLSSSSPAALAETDRRHRTHEGLVEWVDVADVSKHPIFPDVMPFLERSMAHTKGPFTATSDFGSDGNLLFLKFSSKF